MTKKIHLIAAARPNFMKIAPLYHAIAREDWAEQRIVHTGQHYDINMSDAFFQDLGLPEPHIHMGLGAGTHAQQTGRVMIAYEEILCRETPDLVVVVGDVNSTIAATLAAVKLGVKVAHLEAGLRSFDRSMPEEINRVVTDALADLLWTPSPDADDNLLREGIPGNKIHRVGNIMIDSLEMLRSRIESETAYLELGLSAGDYGLITLHRPGNVDCAEKLQELCRTLSRVAQEIPIFFPIHPRTRKNMESYGLMHALREVKGLHLSEPLSYIPFMNMIFNCRFVITDSGGLQEETTYLGIPCITIRPNTERPVTVTQGTNRLCEPNEVEYNVSQVLGSSGGSKKIPDLWDGKTSERVTASMRDFLHVN